MNKSHAVDGPAQCIKTYGLWESSFKYYSTRVKQNLKSSNLIRHRPIIVVCVKRKKHNKETLKKS